MTLARGRPFRHAVSGLFAILGLFVAPGVGAQEALLSDRARYLDTLALDGLAGRSTLAYRTLSDDVNEPGTAEHPWADLNWRRPGDRAVRTFSYRIYGPDTFVSWNSAYPHGMNDGSLWQGVGFNVRLAAGVRVETRGFQATFKPTLSWMENRQYDIRPAAYPDPFSYFWVENSFSIDTPQRFGDLPYGAFDFGDSEIRYSAGAFTAGFGTQAAWIGPARRNPVLLSNNAAPFPKLDIGFRPIRTFAGEVEFRSFWGQLRESDYFDRNPDNDRNLLTGLVLAWAPSFLPGLTVAVNRTMLSRWSELDLEGIFGLFDPFFSEDLWSDSRDQRASIAIDYLNTRAGLQIYLEWARNDFSPSLAWVLRYPYHSQAYTFGVRKAVSFAGGDIRGEILLEVSNLESSRDYEFIGPTTFYSHNRVVQGYTHRGQILGAGIGTGGRSEYLGFTLYHRLGLAEFHLERRNRNNDYVYFRNFGRNGDTKRSDEFRINSEFTAGASAKFFVSRFMTIGLGVAYCLNQNHLYTVMPLGESYVLSNFRFEAGVTLDL